jgi:hypothetical protein
MSALDRLKARLEENGLGSELTKLTKLPSVGFVSANPRPFLKIDVLRLFRFDLIEQEIADGYPAEELRRVNNMAWEFMRHDGMVFDDAIRTAAKVVLTCPPVEGEADYEDVASMWLNLEVPKQAHG